MFTDSNSRSLNWAGFELSEADFETHCLALGTTGSGKSIVVRMLMQSVLPLVGDGSGRRAIIYDAKGDAFPVVSAFADGDRVFTFNPFDARGLAWDIQKDVMEYRVAQDIAEALIPEATENQPFFTNAARDILTEIMAVFMRAKLDWSFADLIRATMSADDAKQLLSRVTTNESLITAYFADSKICSDIFSTLRSKLSSFYPIAFSWEAASHKISLREFMETEAILLLQNAHIGRRPNTAILKSMFTILSHILLSKPETTSDRTYIFVDEVAEAPRLPNLESLAKLSRSKGGRLCLACQTVSGLKASNLYGPEVSLDLLGNFGTRFIGKLECAETADFVSRLIGDQEIMQRSTSETSKGLSDSSTTTNFSPTIRRTLLPSQLLSMSATNSENGLQGFVSLRSHGWLPVQLPSSELFGELLMSPARVPEFIQRDPEFQFPRNWTTEERAIFLPQNALQNKCDLTPKKVLSRPRSVDIVHPEI